MKPQFCAHCGALVDQRQSAHVSFERRLVTYCVDVVDALSPGKPSDAVDAFADGVVATPEFSSEMRVRGVQ